MSDIFREVDEDLRHERLTRLWKLFGPYVIGGAVTIVVTTAAWVGWQEYQTARDQAWAETFAEGMVLNAENNLQVAGTVFSQLAGEAGAGYATLARLDEAAMLARQGDQGAALGIYRELAGDAADQTFKDMAVLLMAYYELDTAAPDELRQRIAPLTLDDNTWHYSAIEITAFLALRTDDRAQARELFTSLANDKNSPRGIQSRAQDMLEILDE